MRVAFYLESENFWSVAVYTARTRATFPLFFTVGCGNPESLKIPGTNRSMDTLSGGDGRIPIEITIALSRTSVGALSATGRN